MANLIPDTEPIPTQEITMEVLCLGMCRTGTQSLAEALTILGYSPIYHMREVRKNDHEKYWIAALEAKFEGRGKQFGRTDFDEFLQNWAGVTDIPAAIFYEELMVAYPEAKVILTVRDENKWFESMKSTIWTIPPTKPLGALTDKHIWGSNPDVHGIQAFKKHNENVLQAAKKMGREVLVYEVKEGWASLCKFLGKEIPYEESIDEEGKIKEKFFPRSDDWATFGWKKTPNVERTDAK